MSVDISSPSEDVVHLIPVFCKQFTVLLLYNYYTIQITCYSLCHITDSLQEHKYEQRVQSLEMDLKKAALKLDEQAKLKDLIEIYLEAAAAEEAKKRKAEADLKSAETKPVKSAEESSRVVIFQANYDKTVTVFQKDKKEAWSSNRSWIIWIQSGFDLF